jgi:hypothetical protein
MTQNADHRAIDPTPAWNRPYEIFLTQMTRLTQNPGPFLFSRIRLLDFFHQTVGLVMAGTIRWPGGQAGPGPIRWLVA